MRYLIRLKILLVLIFIFPGCNSRYYKQNPDDQHLLSGNNNELHDIQIINQTDTNLYYHYRASVTGTRPLFGGNNEFIAAFRYEELGAGRNIILPIRWGETLKIRYKKNKSEVEEKFVVTDLKRIVVTTEGITFFKS
jgi:hypothetical protein